MNKHKNEIQELYNDELGKILIIDSGLPIVTVSWYEKHGMKITQVPRIVWQERSNPINSNDANQEHAESIEPKESWIGQCRIINESLKDCHEIASRIVGPHDSDDGWKEGETFADKLDVELKMITSNVQELVIQLRRVVAKF